MIRFNTALLLAYCMIFYLTNAFIRSSHVIKRRKAFHKMSELEVPEMNAMDYAKTLWETKEGLFSTSVHALIKCNCEGDTKAMFRFAYMPMRNRGEIIRLMLEEKKCPYELEVFGFVPWEKGVKKGVQNMQRKCPVLRNFDGKGNDLCQEGCITRYLADKLGLMGENPEERALVDSLYCFWFSTMRNNGISHDGEHFSIASLKQELLQNKDSSYLKPRKERHKYQDVFRINNLTRCERSLLALDYFESELEKGGGTDYLVGNSPTYVDFGLFYILFELAEQDNVPDFYVKFDLPLLGAFLKRIESRPQILDYLQSPRRMPRYGRESDTGKSLYTYVAGKYSPCIV